VREGERERTTQVGPYLSAGHKVTLVVHHCAEHVGGVLQVASLKQVLEQHVVVHLLRNVVFVDHDVEIPDAHACVVRRETTWRTAQAHKSTGAQACVKQHGNSLERNFDLPDIERGSHERSVGLRVGHRLIIVRIPTHRLVHSNRLWRTRGEWLTLTRQGDTHMHSKQRVRRQGCLRGQTHA